MCAVGQFFQKRGRRGGSRGCRIYTVHPLILTFTFALSIFGFGIGVEGRPLILALALDSAADAVCMPVNWIVHN